MMVPEIEATPGTNDGSRPDEAETIAAKLHDLERTDDAALRAEWRRLYRHEPPKQVGRDLLLLGVAWKLQEQAYGGIGAVYRRRLADLVEQLQREGGSAHARAARLRPGARLIREWNGETHVVLVLENGFEWRGQRWQSLAAIAREITGTRRWGSRFFGLVKRNGRGGGKSEAGPDA